MRQIWGDDPKNWASFIIGDVRDRDRLQMALHGIEYVKANILGSGNVIQASPEAGVKKVVTLSTDKASSPMNLFGATKLTAKKFFNSSNHYATAYDTQFSVVRHGNVMGSRGSVIRLWITLPQAVEDGFSYTSDKNDLWLDETPLKAMLANSGL